MPRQDSNLQSQPVSSRRPTPYNARPLGSACHVSTRKKTLANDDDKHVVHNLRYDYKQKILARIGFDFIATGA
jgi:hypothetical protein